MKKTILSCVLGVLSLTSFPVSGWAAPFAYIPNFGGSSVSIIDTADNAVVKTLSVGGNPQGVAISPDGLTAYISNFSAPEAISVISGETHELITTIPMGTNVEPTGMAILPDGSSLYVANREAGTVSVIDTQANTIDQNIPTGTSPVSVAINPAGTRVYVANLVANTISIIDPASNTVTGTLLLATNPNHLVFNRSGSRLYIGNGFETTEPKVLVVDPTDNTLLASIDLPLQPDGIAVHPLKSTFYVSSQGDLYVIDADTNTIQTTIAFDQSIKSLDVNPAGTRLYAIAWESGNGVVYVINTETNALVDEIGVGADPYAQGPFIGPAPVLQLSRDAIDFGSQRVETESDEEDVLLTNIGSVPLEIDSIDIDPSDFFFDDDCPYELLPNDFCTISVTFEPFETGSQSAEITIESNAPYSPHTIALSGRGSIFGGCSLIRE